MLNSDFLPISNPAMRRLQFFLAAFFVCLSHSWGMSAPQSDKGISCESLFVSMKSIDHLFPHNDSTRPSSDSEALRILKLSAQRWHDLAYREENRLIYRRLYQTSQKKHSPAKFLMKLGFTVDEQEKILVPPSDFFEFFQTLQEQFSQMFNKKRVSEKSRIEPALVFVKHSREVNTHLASDFLLVRPGIDPWPDEQIYRIMTPSKHDSAQVPAMVYHQWLAQGVAPLTFEYAALHDLSHLTEFLEDPSAMIALRQASKSLVQLPADRIGIRNILLARISVMNEFGSAFKLQNVEFYNDLFHQLGLDPGKSADSLEKSEIQTLVNFLSDAKLISLTTRLWEHRFEFLYSMGGSQRDGYNAEMAEQLYLLEAQGLPAKASQSEQSVNYLLTSIHSISKDYLDAHEAGLANESLRYRELLRKYFIQLLYAYTRGMKYQIHRSDIYAAAVNPELERTDRVVKFFESFLPPNSNTYKWWVTNTRQYSQSQK